jgi:hypothetical protein
MAEYPYPEYEGPLCSKCGIPAEAKQSLQSKDPSRTNQYYWTANCDCEKKPDSKYRKFICWVLDYESNNYQVPATDWKALKNKGTKRPSGAFVKQPPPKVQRVTPPPPQRNQLELKQLEQAKEYFSGQQEQALAKMEEMNAKLDAIYALMTIGTAEQAASGSQV